MHSAIINDSSAHSHAVHTLMPQPHDSNTAERYGTAGTAHHSTAAAKAAR